MLFFPGNQLFSCLIYKSPSVSLYFFICILSIMFGVILWWIDRTVGTRNQRLDLLAYFILFPFAFCLNKVRTCCSYEKKKYGINLVGDLQIQADYKSNCKLIFNLSKFQN